MSLRFEDKKVEEFVLEGRRGKSRQSDAVPSGVRSPSEGVVVQLRRRDREVHSYPESTAESVNGLRTN